MIKIFFLFGQYFFGGLNWVANWLDVHFFLQTLWFWVIFVGYAKPKSFLDIMRTNATTRCTVFPFGNCSLAGACPMWAPITPLLLFTQGHPDNPPRRWYLRLFFKTTIAYGVESFEIPCSMSKPRAFSISWTLFDPLITQAITPCSTTFASATRWQSVWVRGTDCWRWATFPLIFDVNILQHLFLTREQQVHGHSLPVEPRCVQKR